MNHRLLTLLLPSLVTAATWVAPKTPDGQPDLEGTWTNATITPFERPAELADKPVLTPEEAAAAEKLAAANRVDRLPNPAMSAATTRSGPTPEPKSLSTLQTSLVVDPPDGRVPLTAGGRSAARL